MYPPIAPAPKYNKKKKNIHSCRQKVAIYNKQNIMTKILATIGPVSSGKNLKTFLEKTDMVRLNLSHNKFEWHKKIINKIIN